MQDKTFYISVTEILNKVVRVKAQDLDEAIEKVEDACAAEELDLDYRDFVDRQEEDVTEETEALISEGITKMGDYLEII